MRRVAALLLLVMTTSCGPGLEGLVYTAAGGDDGDSYRCTNGRQVFARRPSFYPADMVLVVDGARMPLWHAYPSEIDPQNLDAITFWVGEGIWWGLDRRDGSEDRRLYDLGLDGRPIDPDGVLCEKV